MSDLKEHEESGAVKQTIYWDYFLADTSVVTWIFIILLVVASQIFAAWSEFWLVTWTQLQSKSLTRSQSLVHSKFANSADESSFVMVYAALVGLSGVLFFLRTYSLSRMSHRSSSVLFNRLFFGVICSPQHFFDSTPSGRILNRIAKDTAQCDQSLPGTVQDVFAACVQALSVVLAISIISYFAIIPFAVLTAIYFSIQSRYLPASRALKRMEASSRSPIYSHFQETINGLQQIRAFSAFASIDRTLNELYARVDYNTRIYLNSFAVNRWMGFRLEFIGAAVVLFASALSFILFITDSQPNAGLIGLSISLAMNMSVTLNYMCRQISDLEVQLSVVERISEYARLESESSVVALPATLPLSLSEPAQAHVENRQSDLNRKQLLGLSMSWPMNINVSDQTDTELVLRAVKEKRCTIDCGKVLTIPFDWPSAGQIVFENVSVAYRPNLPASLVNVSVTIHPGEKIGIVGRTGAGKSTFSLALFRIVETSKGRIVIDGVDISQVPLHTLRSRLTIIPQDPFLFRGSLRDNLDPFHQFTDEHIWSVLTRLDCGVFVGQTGGLDMFIPGNNDSLALFSVGQRQLLCLARAVLRKSKIMIFDEATASLDYNTDLVMKRILVEELKDCTVITVAHRLSTVLDAQRIVVMENGTVKEFDSPTTLMKNHQTILRTLLEANMNISDDNNTHN